MIHVLQAAYDREAPTYDARFAALQAPKHSAVLALPAVRAALARGPRLDAGCGTGLLAAATPDLAWIGLDLSHAMLGHARARGVACVQGDLAALPFAHGTFALVAAFTALGLDPARPAAGVSELVRVTAPGGLLVVSVLAAQADPVRAALSGVELLDSLACGQDRAFIARRR